MSKKLILIAVMVFLFTVSAFSFEKGTKTVGGGFSLNRAEYDSEVATSLSIRPSGGYFIMDNLMITVNPTFGISWMTGASTRYDYGLGIGAQYFFKKFYAGASIFLDRYRRTSYLAENYWSTQKTMVLSAGHLFGIAQNVYLDLCLDYVRGLGKITRSNFPSSDNDTNYLSIGTGIKVFFK